MILTARAERKIVRRINQNARITIGEIKREGLERMRHTAGRGFEERGFGSMSLEI